MTTFDRSKRPPRLGWAGWLLAAGFLALALWARGRLPEDLSATSAGAGEASGPAVAEIPAQSGTKGKERPADSAGRSSDRAKPKADENGSRAGSGADATPGEGKSNSADKADEADRKLRIPNVSIRDQSGKVVFKGDIDLKPTLDRIAAGKRNEHRNDGSTFQNREGRLPRKSNGYYKEYVHPTPGVGGPGPQRVVIGEEGEVFYTHDHYKSFKRIR